MTQTTKEKALAMVRNEDALGLLNFDAAIEALCRAIEQHEAFEQKVSDAVVQTEEKYGSVIQDNFIRDNLGDFIIPKPQPDPLVKVLEKMGWYNAPNAPKDAENFRTELDALGFEIREKNDV